MSVAIFHWKASFICYGGKETRFYSFETEFLFYETFPLLVWKHETEQKVNLSIFLHVKVEKTREWTWMIRDASKYNFIRTADCIIIFECLFCEFLQFFWHFAA